jgi:hypothetical protein
MKALNRLTVRMPKAVKKPLGKPTMRLITLENCESRVEKFGIAALATSKALETPPNHWPFELDSLPDAQPRSQFPMPWEGNDNISFRAFRAKLPPTVTPDSIFTGVVLPALALPSGAAQRTPEWHQARAFAVTASNFAGTSENAETLLKTKTYPMRYGFNGNAFTEWGSIHEKHAEEAFVGFLKEAGFDGELEHPAHLRDPLRPYLGFSPDALLWSKERDEVDLVEYKCPAGRRSGPGHPYSSDKLNIPSRYMPQLQGSMLLLRALYPTVRCVRAWFVVWQPHQFFVTHVPFVDQFASRTVEQASTFFQDRFLPSCVDAVLEREKRMLTFSTEEDCFAFHESSSINLSTSPAPPFDAASSSSSSTCAMAPVAALAITELADSTAVSTASSSCSVTSASALGNDA